MADPVSDFLTREQNAFAALDENFRDEAQAPAFIEPVVENGIGLLDAPVFNQNDFVLNGNGNNDSCVDLSALDLNDGNQHSLSNGRVASLNSVNSGRGSSVPIEREEPEKIRKWRENKKKLIEEKDEAEEKKKEELREQAKKELEEWHTQRKVRLEQRKKNNRERESQHFELNEKNGDSNTWERIGKLIETKSVRSGTKDTSRMKSLFAAYAEAPPSAAAV